MASTAAPSLASGIDMTFQIVESEAKFHYVKLINYSRVMTQISFFFSKLINCKLVHNKKGHAGQWFLLPSSFFRPRRPRDVKLPKVVVVGTKSSKNRPLRSRSVAL